MPTDYGVTSTKFGYVTLRKDVMCPRRFEKILVMLRKDIICPLPFLKKSLRNATFSISYFIICCISASVQSLRGFMILKSSSLWLPTCGGQLLLKAQRLLLRMQSLLNRGTVLNRLIFPHHCRHRS